MSADWRELLKAETASRNEAWQLDDEVEESPVAHFTYDLPADPIERHALAGLLMITWQRATTGHNLHADAGTVQSVLYSMAEQAGRGDKISLSAARAIGEMTNQVLGVACRRIPKSEPGGSALHKLYTAFQDAFPERDEVRLKPSQSDMWASR